MVSSPNITGNDRAPGPWEHDARPLSDCLKEWAGAKGWRRQDAARELRTPLNTYDRWCDGRPISTREPMIRRMMDLIDQHAVTPANPARNAPQAA